MQIMDLKRFQAYPKWAQDALVKTGKELFDISYELDKNFNESKSVRRSRSAAVPRFTSRLKRKWIFGARRRSARGRR